MEAPARVGEPGALSFRIVGEDGNAVTDFSTSHERKLHLIVATVDA